VERDIDRPSDAAIDPALALLNDRWPALTVATKAAIMALVVKQ